MPNSAIERITAVGYWIPTPEPEADGTLRWDGTTVVVVHAPCGPVTGLGWTSAAGACVDLVHDVLAERVRGMDVLDVPACWHAMQRIESRLFHGCLDPCGGQVRPSLSEPGHGMTFDRKAAERYQLSRPN